MAYVVAVVGATGAVGAQMIKNVGRVNTSNRESAFPCFCPFSR